MSISLTKREKPQPNQFIAKGFWAGHNYYKRSHVSFIGECVVIINDEILHNMYYYYLNLIDVYHSKSENGKLFKEIERVEEFLIKYQKK
jgi:hypothetical protein